MTDFNFFAPYQGKQKQVVNKKIYVYTISVAVALFIIGTLLWNNISIFLINKDINKYQTAINSTKIKDKVKEAQEISNKIDALSKYDSGISKISEAVTKRNTISSALLSDINSTLPQDVYFKSISVDGGSLSVQGSSKTRTAIAELQHNIKGLSIIADAQIGNISQEDSGAGNYNFDLKCTLKEGDSK